ncbi:unnamed protein product [Diamesa tonsa]
MNIMKRFYISKTAKASWVKSHDICKSFGMELATFDIPNEAEQLLVNYRLHSTKQPNVWVGYTDQNHEGVWTSNKGKQMDKNISFHAGELNDKTGIENCLEINFSNNQYKFNDVNCNKELHFMCEHKTAIPTVDDCKMSLEKQESDHHVDKGKDDVFELNISDSKTKFLSNSLFHYFERLRKIKIVKSQLQSLSNGVFSGAEYLRKVFIQGNNIKSITSNTFKGADNLNILNLDNNQIEFVAREAFDGLEYLTTLILINNKLKKIPTNTLNTLYNLMYFKVSANEFDKLDGSLLKNNTLLREVWFDRNSISNIGSDLLTYSDKYQRVVFSDNICIDNDSEHTCFDTVQKEILVKCSGINTKKGSNAKAWAKCPSRKDDKV